MTAESMNDMTSRRGTTRKLPDVLPTLYPLSTECPTADVHGCSRAVAPLRHPLAIRDVSVAHTGAETTQSTSPCPGCAPTRPSSFRFLAMPSLHWMLVRNH